MTTTAGADESRAPDESLVARAVRRRTGGRQAAAEEEIGRLLEVGLRLMQEDPAGSPRIADIVRAAGVSNDAFYRAFRGKDDLMAAIVDDGARRLLGYVRHQRDKEPDAAAQLRACVEAVFSQAVDPRIAATTRAVLRSAAGAQPRTAGVVGVRERLAGELVGPLRALPSSDPERDALVVAVATFAVMEQFLWGEQVPTADDVEHFVAFVLRGVTAA
jgi:AcrR family transcriptional regulator